MFGLEHWGVEPDMVQFAKGVTSGYFPLGGVGFHDRIAEVFDEPEQTWMHAYTYSGHPVGCAVALRNLQILEDEEFVAQATAKGQMLLSELRQQLAGHPHVGEVRGLGLMCAVELVADPSTREPFAPEEKVGLRVHQAAQELGMFSRMRGDVFCLAPPIPTSEDLLREICQIVRRAVDAGAASLAWLPLICLWRRTSPRQRDARARTVAKANPHRGPLNVADRNVADR